MDRAGGSWVAFYFAANKFTPDASGSICGTCVNVGQQCSGKRYVLAGCFVLFQKLSVPTRRAMWTSTARPVGGGFGSRYAPASSCMVFRVQPWRVVVRRVVARRAWSLPAALSPEYGESDVLH